MNKTIAFDLSSGDKESSVAFKAAVDFLNLNKDWKIIAFTSEDIDLSNVNLNIEIRKCSQIIEMNDGALEVRRKNDSTLIKSIESVLNNEASAVVSAAASGPLVTAGYLVFKSINGLKPAFVPFAKRLSGKPMVALDIGANIGITPEQINQYAEMGTIFAKVLEYSNNPKVKLLNIGEEEKKGTELQVNSFKIMKENKKINFLGNLEANQILLDDSYDVLVSDAFSGNIALKSIEGTLESLKFIIKNSMKSSFSSKIGIYLSKKFRNDMKKFALGLTGGAVVLGLNEILIKSHGNSNQNDYLNTLITAKKLIEKDLINLLKEVL